MKSEDGREFRAVEDEEGNEVRKGATILEKDEEYNEAMQQWEAEKLEILETERQILDAEEEEELKQKYGEEQSQEWSSKSEAAVPGGATDAATLDRAESQLQDTLDRGAVEDGTIRARHFSCSGDRRRVGDRGA